MKYQSNSRDATVAKGLKQEEVRKKGQICEEGA